MAYTQKPGRGNSAKTGNGLPSALLQKKTNVKTSQNVSPTNVSTELNEKVEATTQFNKLRKEIEAKAKTDSITASGQRGGTKFQNQMAGNKAANATRSAAGAGDMNVYRGKDTEGRTTYSRDKNVELEHVTAVKNKKTGQYTYDKKENQGRKTKSWVTPSA